MFKRLAQILSALGVNGVPAAGWAFTHWSSGTVLTVYWFETVAASLLVAARIALHRSAVPCAGHVTYRPRESGAQTGRRAGGSFLGHFLTVSLVFSAAHGIFLAAIFFVFTKNGHGAEIGLDWTEVWNGAGVVLGFLLMSFVADLPGLRRWPFAWIERRADMNLGRVAVVHLAIVFGLAAVAFTGASRALFAVFFGFKTMSDVALALPPWFPDRPPRWLCWALDRVPSRRAGPKKGAATFAEFWAADKAAEIARREANEKPGC